MSKIKFKKGRCTYAIYYDVFYMSGSIRLWIENRNPRKLFLSNLIVNPEDRNKGIGSTLLNYSEKAARKLGIKRIDLKVRKDSWMESWYKRCGYKEDNILDEIVKFLYKDIL